MAMLHDSGSVFGLRTFAQLPLLDRDHLRSFDVEFVQLSKTPDILHHATFSRFYTRV